VIVFFQSISSATQDSFYTFPNIINIALYQQQFKITMSITFKKD